MSNADPEELVTASSDGVSVEKSFEPDDFPVPAIAFVVRSERDEQVSVRLVDSVPSHVPPEDIGFHPKYGAEFWGVEGDSIVFEREFEAGEEYTTVYGLRGGDAEDVEQFLTEPEIEDVDPPLGEADAGQTVRDVIGESEPDDAADDGAAGGVEGADEIATAVEQVDTGAESEADAAEDGETPGGIEDVPDTSVDLGGPDVDEAEEEASTGTELDIDTADAGTAGASATGGESLVAALAAEIRSGGVDDEAVEDLRDALGVDLASASVEARIEHLQSTVSDLEAYTDALEAFLDENGDAQRIIREVREDFEAATERFDDLEATAEEAASTAESVDDRLDERFDEFESRLESELDDVEARVDETLAEVDEELEAVDERVDRRVDEELEEVWTAVDEAAADAADVREELQTVREEVGEATEERLEELETDIEDLSDELEDLAEMRDRLASALGGLAPQGDAVDDADGSDDPDATAE